MGWERKRGKLSEFNRLLRGDRGTSYTVVSADPADLPRVRFVITLDSDTKTTRDTAGRLVGDDRPPAQPAEVRPDAGPGGRGLRRLAAEGELPA